MTVQCSMHCSEFASLCLLMCRSLIPLKDSFSKYFYMYLPLKCIRPSGCCCCSLSYHPNACICLGLRLCLFFSCTCSTHSTQTAAYSRLQIKRILSLLLYIVVFFPRYLFSSIHSIRIFFFSRMFRIYVAIDLRIVHHIVWCYCYCCSCCFWFHALIYFRLSRILCHMQFYYTIYKLFLFYIFL